MLFRSYSQIHLLVVDDDSQDGTVDEVASLQKNFERLSLIRRQGVVKGLGKSYIAGMQWALQQGMEKIIQMDADFSHDPQAISLLLEKSRESDVVVGSRYIDGGRIVNWPWQRLVASKAANGYIRLITRLPIHDCTSGFKCWNARVLKKINLGKVYSEGYAFLVETIYRAYKNGFSIVELPIVFVERERGESKIWKSGILESFFKPWKLVLADQRD